MLLSIEKLIYGGDGLAHLPPDASGRGKAVFVPFVLAGEQVDATLLEQKPGFARARADKITEPSKQRIPPDCPYFARCGGCHYQHTSYEHQLSIKTEILRETIRRTAKIDLDLEIQVHPSPPWNYRNRSRLQIQTEPAFTLGYFKSNSREILPVERCPISSPLINLGIHALWGLASENKVPPGVREVEFFANADDSQLLVQISCAKNARRASIRAFVEDLGARMPQIAGVVAFREADKTRELEKFLVAGASHLTYKTQRAEYRVSAGSFFQTNRHLIDELVNIVTQGQAGESALDFYAGVGLFSTALCDMRHVVSVESSQTSSGDLSYNLSSNGEAVRATTEQYLARSDNQRRIGTGVVLPHIHKKPDLAVVDPPRSGLGERVARMVATLGASRVVYVSCDPATLARDLVPFLAAGYRMQQLHLVDLFPQTYHLETVAHLVR